MGTRSLICIIYHGDFAVAQYCEFDGYPEGQGLKILSFLREDRNIRHLKDGLVKTYSPSETELEEMYDSMKRLDTMGLEESRRACTFQDGCSFEKSPLTQTWPSLSPEAGARILTVIAQPHRETKWEIPLVKQLEFVNNTLFCEWVYVIDLDAEFFEVFGGSQKKSESVIKRFANVGDKNATVPKLIAKFHFDHLPRTQREFQEAIEPEER